eukprot:COSAG05_NODE_963_length_6408_cov_4.077984_2_plen_167_part_00
MKHPRYFKVEAGRMISWDKKNPKPGKRARKSGNLIPLLPRINPSRAILHVIVHVMNDATELLRGVEAQPAIKTAREWFDLIDADGSGELKAGELAELYRQARGEKLRKQSLKDAMAQVPATSDTVFHTYPSRPVHALLELWGGGIFVRCMGNEVDHKFSDHASMRD